jgi:hypothetical protein
VTSLSVFNRIQVKELMEETGFEEIYTTVRNAMGVQDGKTDSSISCFLIS